MAEPAKVDAFCPNPVCPDYEQVRESGNNIIKSGRTRSGRWRYKHRRRGETFTETRGAVFRRRRTDEKEIPECPAVVAEGFRISRGRIDGPRSRIGNRYKRRLRRRGKKDILKRRRADGFFVRR